MMYPRLYLARRLLLAEERLLANTRSVQARNDIELSDVTAPLAAWELFDAAANASRHCPHFSVEMETGTGKTYVYLRTIFELSRRYGFQKFIVVVPSVAIREGVAQEHRHHPRPFPRALQQSAVRVLRLRCAEGQSPAPVRHRQHCKSA